MRFHILKYMSHCLKQAYLTRWRPSLFRRMCRRRFQELKRVLHTDGAISCKHRLRLYQAIIWPTLWYGGYG